MTKLKDELKNSYRKKHFSEDLQPESYLIFILNGVVSWTSFQYIIRCRVLLLPFVSSLLTPVMPRLSVHSSQAATLYKIYFLSFGICDKPLGPPT